MVKRVLNIEDNMFKQSDIKKALNKVGVVEVDLATNAEEGLRMIDTAIKEGKEYDLLITDMHFSVNGQDRDEAGLYVIEELKKSNIDIPIAVCSSVRYRIPEVLECIYYNERSGDLDGDIRSLIGRM